jgi:hypothetical protein
VHQLYQVLDAAGRGRDETPAIVDALAMLTGGN